MAKGKAGKGHLADDDQTLWAHVTREIAPLRRRKSLPAAKAQDERARAAAEPANAAARAAHATPPRSARPLVAAARLPELSHDDAPGLDSRTAERLRRGQLRPEATIDLHGHTQEEAHRALTAFIEGAWHRRMRCLLVITGKGRGPANAGVLRAAVPRWLNGEPVRRQLLAFANARPADGGAGALYVLLRRQR